ncbi:HNH endonuclease family protein [Klebsiella aerogenes]|uniref:hypothetical protein n=1 Tax=Klebsiella aerogenes TaxID=548 RepID=UPI003751F23D
MRKINKIAPPASFIEWVNQKPRNMNDNQWFQELYKQERWDVVSDLSEHNAREQFYLCAYCCSEISGESNDTVNEHVEARAQAPHRSLDFTNIVASCKTKGQCDEHHKSQILPLTPLMDECETEFSFNISGRVEGSTDRANESIKVLNLGDKEKNNKRLIEKRKQLSHNLLMINGLEPDEGLEDDELLRSVIVDLLTPQDGKLAPFAPVVANILRSWISS